MLGPSELPTDRRCNCYLPKVGPGSPGSNPNDGPSE